MRSASTIKVILADDHELFRDGFCVMLKKQSQVELIGEAEDGEELLLNVERLRPDVVITDIKMPKMDGIAVMHKMKHDYPHIGVIALTNFDEESLIIDMLEAGAKGYLLKNAHKEQIVQAVITVYRNRSFYCNHVNAKIAQFIAKSSFNSYRKQSKVSFNERELQIIRLICEQYTNKEIGEKLFLSKRTVETHRENILEKMKVKNTAGIVVFAIKHDLFRP